jgi:tetratricopeptide (TPR) repeat protein
LNEPLQEAARLYAARDYKAADSVCRAIIHAAARHFDALHVLGVLLTLQDRPDEAVTYLRRAKAEWPDHPRMRVNLGNALLATQRYDETIAVSQTNDPGALNNLGLAHRGLGQHEAAADAFKRATQTRWDHAAAWANLATTLMQLGQPEPALYAATTALRVAPLDTPGPPGWPMSPTRSVTRCWLLAARMSRWRPAAISSNATRTRKPSSGT